MTIICPADDVEARAAVKAAYDVMQNQYVLRRQDMIQYEDAVLSLGRMQEQLLQNQAWVSARPVQEQRENPAFGMQMEML